MQKTKINAHVLPAVWVWFLLLVGVGCEDSARTDTANVNDASFRDVVVIIDGNVDGNARIDDDLDGYPPGVDCDDHNPAINPAAAEVCDELGVDEDCNPCTVSGVTSQEGGLTNDGDEDNDGLIYAGCVNRVALPGTDAGTVPTCRDRQNFHVGGMTFIAGTDCDDRHLSIPAQRSGSLCTSVCGSGMGAQWTLRYVDGDNDGQGGDQVRLVQCNSLRGTSDRTGDCNDTDGLMNSEAPEVCNFRDDNCDDFVDNLRGGTEMCRCENCTTSCDRNVGVGIATGRRETCGSSTAVCQPPPETCNGRDDDCNNMVDEGFECVNGQTRAWACGLVSGFQRCSGCLWSSPEVSSRVVVQTSTPSSSYHLAPARYRLRLTWWSRDSAVRFFLNDGDRDNTNIFTSERIHTGWCDQPRGQESRAVEFEVLPYRQQNCRNIQFIFSVETGSCVDLWMQHGPRTASIESFSIERISEFY